MRSLGTDYAPLVYAADGRAAQAASSPASMAGLPGSSAWVCVGPPLSVSGPRRGSGPALNPQVPSSTMLLPLSVTAFPASMKQSLPDGLLAVMLFFRLTKPP